MKEIVPSKAPFIKNIGEVGIIDIINNSENILSLTASKIEPSSDWIFKYLAILPSK